MKTLMIAAGALALSSTAVLAQSAYPDDGYVTVEHEAYAAPTGWAGSSMYESPAPGFAPQADTQASERTPNMGAGTSRSNAANNG